MTNAFEYLPILLIVLPIVAATLPLVLGLVRPNTGWPVAVVALLGELVLAGVLAWYVLPSGRGTGDFVHRLGDYGTTDKGGTTYEVGIELVADELSVLVVVLIAAVSLGVLAFSRRAGPRGNAFYSAYLLLAGGLMGVAQTGDMFNLFVFLEITGLSTYTLVAADRSGEAAVAALKYLIVGTIGASLYLIGVAYLFVATGTLNMADMATVLESQSVAEGALYTDTLVLAGFGFITTGLFVKSAIFPLHTWQPDAYAAAPDSVTAYISALVSTLGAYAFARISLTVFTPKFFEETQAAADAVLILASISIVAGAALAVTQDELKRVFAYSSVSQFGLIAAAVGIAVHPEAIDATLGTIGGSPVETAAEAAAIGAVVHLIGHGLMKGGLFVAAGAIARETGARRLSELNGLGKHKPLLSAGIAIIALVLVGVPPAVGFLGKWYIALGAVSAKLWWVAVVILVSTLLTLAYVARLLERLYFTPAEAGAPVETPAAPTAEQGVATDGGTHSASLGALVLLALTTVLVVALGFAGDAIAYNLEPFLEEVFSNG
jgi:multicomponent Na+:H+ antiporter subunit D